jgi:dephospho-CoA kinase
MAGSRGIRPSLRSPRIAGVNRPGSIVRVYLIGLTGGIASGKSVASSRLAERGAIIIDADVVAREVVAPGTAGLAEIFAEFGSGMLREDGSLDRAALGAVVFTDEQKRERLNAITHPKIWRRTKELIAEAEGRDAGAIVVYDVPLLAEAAGKRDLDFDLVVVVHADADTRIQRMVEHRGMLQEEAQRRINSQASDAERLAIADVVIDNNGALADTLAQVDTLWDRVSQQETRNRH